MKERMFELTVFPYHDPMFPKYIVYQIDDIDTQVVFKSDSKSSTKIWLDLNSLSVGRGYYIDRSGPKIVNCISILLVEKTADLRSP